MKKIKNQYDVFFKKYGNNTIVHKTTSQKVYVMNEICYDILIFFKDYHKVDDLIPYLETIYATNVTDDYKKSLNDFVEYLYNEDILKEEFKPYEEVYGLESITEHSDIIPALTLTKVMIELTYRCNEKCRHCYCVNPDISRELSTNKIKSILDELSDFNVSEVTFTGGDLFIRKDAFELLDYAYSKNLMINIFTNGTLLKDEDFYHLKRLALKSISFSIYSHIPEKHDYFTQLEGSFNKTLIAAKKCIDLGIPVNIKSSIVDYNFDDLKGIIDLDLSIGAYPQISMAITPKNNGDLESTKLRINNIKKYKTALKISSSFIDPEFHPEYTDLVIKENKICWAGSNSLSINPYGEVYACNALLIKVGDINNETIKNIWNNSTKLKEIRSYNMNMLKGCENCKIKKYCSFCPGSAYSEHNDPLMKYMEACNVAQAKYENRKEDR